MRKITALILVLVLAVCFCGCNEQLPQKVKLIDADNIKCVSVTSLPKGYEYSFDGDDAKAVADYLLKLNLIADFKENPDEYVGMTWVVSLEYENGDIKTVYHAANMFIRTDDGPWYQMTYEEASRFAALLHELNETTPPTQTHGSTEPTGTTAPQPVKYPLFSEQALSNYPVTISEQEYDQISKELNDILSRKSYDETGKELVWNTVALLCRYYPNFEYLFSFLNPLDTATYLRKNVLNPLDSMVETLLITRNHQGGGWASDTTKTVSIDLSNSMEENVRVMIHELNHMVVGKEHNIVSSKLYMPLSEGGATLHELAITGCGTYNEVGSIYMNDISAVENWYPDPDKEGFYFRGKGMRADEYADRSCLYFKLLALTDFETMCLFEQPDGELLIREELGKRYGEDGLRLYDSLPFAPDFDSILDTEPLFLNLFVSRLTEVETPDQMLSYLLLYRLYRMAFAPEYLYYEVDSYEQMHPLLDYTVADRTVAEAVVRWGVLNGEALSQEDTALAALVLSGRTLTKDNTDYWERHTREFYNPLSPFLIVESWYTTEEVISIRCISQYPYLGGISYFERELAGDLHAMVAEEIPKS